MFYTNVQVAGKFILLRGVNDQGKRYSTRISYSPTLYVPSQKITNFTSLDGEYLQPMKFETISEARDFVKQYSEVDNFRIFGNTNYQYAFIADEYTKEVHWDESKISIAVIDLEVGSENGFPDPYKATEPITAITIHFVNGTTFVFGMGAYEVKGEEKYIKCKDEWTLCKKFLTLWKDKCPDVVSGWNTKFFDIPYLYNRLCKILGEEDAKQLSPWNNVHQRTTNNNGRELTFYEISGVASLDYLELYKWYAPKGKSQESYRLDAIAHEELKDNKLSYDEYDNLHSLYRMNHQKFIEYNIKDVMLIVRMEEKLKLIQLALSLAYDTKSNYEDVFAQTRMWDAIIYSYLLNQNIIVPPRVVKDKDAAFDGAYVKDPIVGLHKCVVSFDLDSLYPHLMMEFNLSPETIIEPKDYTPAMRDILSSGISIEKLLEKSVDLSGLENTTVTPNGQFFRTNIKGFLPKLLEEMYEDRKKYKKLMLKAKQDLIDCKDDAKKPEIEARISRYNNLQLAKKVSLNSAYGAFGSKYFRLFDLRQAIAVTSSGQLAIRWIANKLNGYMNKLLETNTDYVIASDTDSIYLNMGPLVDKVFKDSPSTEKIIDFMDKVSEEKIQPFIQKSYQELADYTHAYAQKMNMKRENLCDKGIWTAKKRYILNVYDSEGVRYTEPELKVTGLEMIKSSTPSVIRDKMKQSIKIIINGTQDDIHTFIETARMEFRKLPVEDISFPRGVSGVSEYSDKDTIYKKGTPIHVRGALVYNHNIREKGLSKKYQEIKEGEKLKFVYLRLPNPIRSDVIAFPNRLPPEFDLEKYVDRDIQFQKTFIEPIKIVLDCIGWTTEKSHSLFD